jgi:hypothetical protein
MKEGVYRVSSTKQTKRLKTEKREKEREIHTERIRNRERERTIRERDEKDKEVNNVEPHPFFFLSSVFHTLAGIGRADIVAVHVLRDCKRRRCEKKEETHGSRKKRRERERENGIFHYC